MKRTLGTTIAALTIGLAPLAAEADSGKEVLLKAREAIQRAKVVRYQGNYTATGYIKQWVKDVRGKVLVGEKAEYDVPRFLLQVELAEGDDDASKRYTVGCDGDQYFLVDAETKTVYADLDPAVMGSNSRSIQRILLGEFGNEKAFEDELKADHIELEQDESVEGEDCAVVRVKNESSPDVLWWISKKDHLPRRVRRLYKDDKRGEGTTELTLSALAVNPPVKDDPFRVRTPKGFKKTDDFAP